MKRQIHVAKSLSLIIVILSLLSLSSLFASTISGQITGNENLPLAGSRVTLINVTDIPDSVMNIVNNLVGRHGDGGGDHNDGDCPNQTFVFTNPEGNYLFENVAIGSYIVAASKPGYEQGVYSADPETEVSVIEIDADDQEVSGINIQLLNHVTPPNPFGPGRAIGRVVNAQNQGIAHVHIGIVSVENPTEIIEHFMSMSNFNGIYQINSLAISEIAYKTVAMNPMTHEIMAYSNEFFITQDNFIVDSVNITIDAEAYESYAVSGNLISDNAQEINHRHLVLFGVNSDSSAFHPYIVRHTMSNETGAYIFENIPNGSYKIKLHSGFGLPVFYPGTSDYEAAGTIIVDGASVENANIVFNTQTSFTLAGTVKEAITEAPLANITVTVDLFGNHHPNADSTFESISTLTDAEGNYSLVVPFGFYSLAAYSNDETYQTQYYDHTQNPFRARIIRAFHDYDNLNFDLLPANATAEYSISGTIAYNDSLPPVPVMVIAVSSDEDWEETTVTDEFGAYNLPIYNTGNYYVIACSPLAPPTYYENSLSWENANLVNVDANITGINFNLIGTEIVGPNQIDGTILASDGTPLSNVTVAINDQDGQLVSFARTNEDGQYTILNVPSQDLQMLVTSMGYYSISENVNVNGNESMDYTLNSNTLSDNDNTVQTQKFSMNNYPNPFNPNTTISFNLVNDEQISLDIYNIKGQKVKSFFNTKLNKGTHNVVWNGKDNDGKNVSSGIYFCKIKGEKTNSSHKMLLMK